MSEMLFGMPVGYYLMKASEGYYVLRDDGSSFMKRLQNKKGEDKCFSSPGQAADYASKHFVLNLNYDQEVPEVLES